MILTYTEIKAIYDCQLTSSQRIDQDIQEKIDKEIADDMDWQYKQLIKGTISMREISKFIFNSAKMFSSQLK